MSTTTLRNSRPSAPQPTGGKKASHKSKSEWLAPAILTAKTIGAAAQCTPFPYIKGVSDIALILLEAVDKVEKNREDLKELCDSTTEIIKILYEQILTHGSTAAVKFQALCQELKSYLEAVVLVIQNLQNIPKGLRGRFKEFMNSSSTADEISGYQKQIQGLCSQLKLMAVVDTNFRVNEIHAIVTAPSFAVAPVVQRINNCPSPSRIFQGRHIVLKRMHQFFGTNPGRQLIYVLHGLGGVGKTQIALKFIQEFSVNVSDILLVDASTLDTIDTALKNIAVSKGVGDSAQDALNCLQSKHKGWLLFFDNADDRKINVNEFFPHCDHGSIIITTRNPGLKVYGEHSPVSDMEETDAIALLLRSAAKESSEENIQTAAKIVKELYYLPLAIAQAGAFISKSEDLNSYLALYAENRARLLREKPEQSHDQYAWTVYTTWQISFDQLSKPAAMLLQLCSFLHYTGISEDIFRNASKYSFPLWLPPKEDLQEPLEFLLCFLGPNGEWSSLNFLDVTNEIKAYSLISFDAATKMFSIHPLVHGWSQSTLVDEGSSRLCIRSILGMSISEIPDHDVVLPSLRLMPHVGLAMPFNANVGADFRAAFWGIYLGAGKLKEAQKLIEQTFEKYRLVFGEGHLATLEAMHRLAVTYRYLGEYKKAEQLEVTVVEKRTKLLGEDDPETLSAMGTLATTYSKLGDFTKAKELEVTVLEKRTTLLGEDHPKTLNTMGNLGTTYSKLGDFAKAKELEATVLEKRTKFLGEDHPETLRAMVNLATTYSGLGDLAKAKELKLTVLEKRTKFLGEDHPETLSTMGKLATTYSKLGDFTKAKELEVTVLEKRTTLLGEDHPKTLNTMENLATTYSKLGDFAKAKELEVTVLEKRTMLLGEDHPHTLKAMASLAVTYYNQREFTKAEELQIVVLKKQRQVFGDGHPHSILAMQSLASTYQKLNKSKEAEELEQLIQDTEKAS